MSPRTAFLRATVVAACACSSSATATLEVTRSVFGSGVGMATGPTQTVRYTAGQVSVSEATSNRWKVSSGFWAAHFTTVTSVPEVDTPLIPTTYRLHQNLPNPFNPRTTIHYDLPRDARVRLRLFDLAGRLVRTLEDGFKSAGARKIVWDGTDDRGNKLSSGVYVYVLETSDYRATKKLVLVR